MPIVYLGGCSLIGWRFQLSDPYFDVFSCDWLHTEADAEVALDA